VLAVELIEKHINAEVKKKKRIFTEKKARRSNTHIKGKGRHTGADIAASIFTVFAPFNSLSGNKFTVVLGNSRSTSKSFLQERLHPSKCVTPPPPRHVQ